MNMKSDLIASTDHYIVYTNLSIAVVVNVVESVK